MLRAHHCCLSRCCAHIIAVFPGVARTSLLSSVAYATFLFVLFKTVCYSLKFCFAQALADLANVQATVNIRNEKLEQYEIVDKSLKDAYRDKESEMMKMKREVEEARNELREKENAMEQVKELFEKQMAQEIIKGLQLS